MDWQRFTFEYEMDANGMIPNVVHIEAYKEAAINLVLPPDWQQQLDKLNRVRAVHGTTALEGNPLSEAEVARQMEVAQMIGPRLPGGATKEQLQIRNAGLAQEWVKKRFLADSFSVLALPPLFPPRILRATVSGILVRILDRSQSIT